MKKLVMAFLLTTGVALGAAAQDKDNDKVQEKDVPQAIQTSFKNSYSNVRDVEWKLKDGKYKAEFEIDGKDHFAGFDSTGSILMKGMEITKDELPSAIISTIQTSYAAAKIDDVYKIEEGGQVKYKVELDDEQDRKVIFSADGKVLEDKPEDNVKQ